MTYSPTHSTAMITNLKLKFNHSNRMYKILTALSTRNLFSKSVTVS